MAFDGTTAFVAANRADGTGAVYVFSADLDGDGVPNDEDLCEWSDLTATVVIDGCDSGVTNQVFSDGCSFLDLIAACAANAKNHGKFVSCVSKLTNG